MKDILVIGGGKIGSVVAALLADTPEAGGYRVTGRCGFSSGSPHAAWIAPQAQIVENGQTRLVDGKPDQVWRIEIKNGEAYNHDFNFGTTTEVPQDKPPPKEPEKPSRPIPKSVFIVGGATIALGAAGAVVGVLAKGARDEFETANGKETDKAKLESMRSNVVTMNLVADISFGLALAGAATTGRPN